MKTHGISYLVQRALRLVKQDIRRHFRRFISHADVDESPDVANDGRRSIWDSATGVRVTRLLVATVSLTRSPVPFCDATMEELKLFGMLPEQTFVCLIMLNIEGGGSKELGRHASRRSPAHRY